MISRVLARVLVTAGLCLAPANVRPEEMSIPSLKAAFLVNFVKFAEWPAGALPAGGSFTFCVAGDRTVFEALEGMMRPPRRRDLGVVSYVPPGGPFSQCHLLFLGGRDARDWRVVIDSLQHAPVFTVGDTRGFAEAGGIAELRLDNGKMRFNINPAAAHRGRIALSAKLLSLATLVREKSNDSR